MLQEYRIELGAPCSACDLTIPERDLETESLTERAFGCHDTSPVCISPGPETPNLRFITRDELIQVQEDHRSESHWRRMAVVVLKYADEHGADLAVLGWGTDRACEVQEITSCGRGNLQSHLIARAQLRKYIAGVLGYALPSK